MIDILIKDCMKRTPSVRILLLLTARLFLQFRMDEITGKPASLYLSWLKGAGNLHILIPSFLFSSVVHLVE